MNQAQRWKEFISWWSTVKIKDYDDELQLFAAVWEKVDEIKEDK